MRLVILTLWAGVAATHAIAGLEWEHTVLEIDAAPLDETAEAVFRFTNTGTNPVTITETLATCGCTVPTLDKKTFAPGEAGELRLVYTIAEGTVGPQEKTVTVQTADADSSLLTLRVDVAALWDVQPKFVKWERDEASAAKAVTIRALHPELARPVAVESRDTRFTAELQESPDEAGLFIVTITPERTDVPMYTSLAVATDAPAEKKRVVQLYAVVR